MTGDKPDWDYWLNLAEVPLEDAICLSLGYSPRILAELDENYVRANRAQMLSTFSANFAARHHAAQTHITARSLKARFNSLKGAYFVSLVDFRDWAESLPVPFTFPEEFPKSLPAPEPDPPAKIVPSPRNENANLRIIAAMLALLRDRDGGRFPSDATVIDVLVGKYGAADGVSKRNLESVFPAAKRAAGDDLKPKT